MGWDSRGARVSAFYCVSRRKNKQEPHNNNNPLIPLLHKHNGNHKMKLTINMKNKDRYNDNDDVPSEKIDVGRKQEENVKIRKR
jgi:hypothetical protein